MPGIGGGRSPRSRAGSGKTCRTLKFRLDGRSDDLDFQTASQAYDVTEGIGQGSLIGLVCAVHLSGFRLFSKASETRRFRNRSRYPEAAFSDALKAHTGIEGSRITIQSIEDVFATPPRARGGSPPAWSADDLARRLFQAWSGRFSKGRRCRPTDPRSCCRDRPRGGSGVRWLAGSRGKQ